MVCVNLLHSSNIAKHIKFDTAKNFSSIYHSMLDESYDTFKSSKESIRKQTNPFLDAVKDAVPMFRKPRVVLADNMRGMILDTAKSSTEAVGKDALVFPIPNHSDLVLRVEKSALADIDKLPKDLELVPIKYDKSLFDNQHLGLPLYYVTSKTGSMARKNTISPMEALAQQNKIMVLRKVTGQHPSSECGNKFESMVGFDGDNHLDIDTLNNFAFIFGYAKNNFGPKASAKCLEYFRSGATQIPENALGEGSTPFKIVKGNEFCKLYDDFATSHIESLKEISELPQKAYDDAVGFITSEKNFNVDFQHTNNTFVDLSKKEFNFMDFAYDKSDEKYIYENPIKEFRNVLFGKGFKRLDSLKGLIRHMPRYNYPRDFIVTPEYIDGVKTYARVINDKINLTAPKEFQSEKVFK